MGPFFKHPQQPELYVADKVALEESIRHPPCSCHDCQTGFYLANEQYRPPLSYRSRISDADARHLVESYTKEIHENRKSLTESLKSHADLLMSRWRKRSQEKRQALLMAAAPDLEPSPWLNMRYCYMNERKLIDCRSLRRRRQLLAPWLNVNVLKTNPSVLYALLHYRVAYQPQDWAAFDCRQLTLSWACGWFDVDFCNKCVVMYGPRYGTLVDWEEAAAHRADIIGFPRARLVLEAQSFIMTTLRSIVDKILDGVDDSLPVRTQKWSELTANASFKHTGEVEFWSPYTNQAFSAPPLLDTDYLVSLANTRLEATGDHLWHLQCDPAYMRRHMKIYSRKSIAKVAEENEAARHFAFEVYVEVLGHYWWHWIETECKNVANLHRRFRDSIYPGNPLPPRYDRALGALELVLVNQVIYRVQILHQIIPYCPGFSHHWTLKRDADTPQGCIKLQRDTSNNTKEAFENDPLDWCLLQLLGMPDQQTHFDHAMLFAFLQDHLSHCSSKEKARLDESLYKNLSDLSTCHEMLVAVRLSRPQNKARDIKEVLASETDRDRQAWKKMAQNEAPPSPPLGDLERSGMGLFKNLYAKPPSGQKNLEWLRQSRTNRAALEAFWNSMREIIRKCFTGYTFTTEDIDGLLQIISADKTSEYIDAVRSEENKILADVESNKTEPMLRNLTLNDPGQQFKREVQSPREKIKSRPESSVVQPTATAAPSTPTPAAGTESSVKNDGVIAVSERSLNIFSFMFPETAEESTKTVGWDDFVHAICDVGFTARNNGGSAVLFESIDGKIVFHKPHPVVKIDSIMLRSMGKRMTKWFGWSRERFVLADANIDKSST
ncbi:uncharacterized protein F4807DRAFT_439773 [Annulohypoxylon truncatum]|uniref:uncharacterized protein n=1 Tax=Annulohypoxylon truncatum TaxID=327061 RepID=UPI002007B405|nr:uncharacterized protein F4807DRAFT_439773 [Annulohypoxylon truncatum]KAI1206352.1 hypothetical protein F4807DRAFT_439773 [Annulohypoxylon truncatum]